MSVPSLSSIVAIGVDILNAVRDSVTKTVLFQTGDVVTSQVESDRVESWQHVGFVSLPSNPVPGKAACQGVVWKRGDIDVCTNTRDLRGQALAGTLAAGETCMYAGGADGNAQGRVLCKADGSVAVYTTKGNVTGGTGMGIFVNPDGSVSVLSHTGAAVTIGADGSAKIFNKAGAIQVMPDGTVKIGSTKKIAMAAPNVTVGAAAQPLVTQAGLVAALTAIANAISLITPGSSTTGGAPATAAISAAITALTGAPPNVTKSFQAS